MSRRPKLYMTNEQFKEFLNSMTDEQKFAMSQNIMNNYAEKHIKPQLNDTYYYEMKTSIIKTLEDKIFTFTGDRWNRIRGLNKDLEQELIEKTKTEMNILCKNLIENEITKFFSEKIDSFRNSCQEKYSFYLEKIKSSEKSYSEYLETASKNKIEETKIKISEGIKDTFLKTFKIG